MKTHITFTLRDSTQHDTIDRAKNHCDEMMGAELRDFAFEKGHHQYVYQMMLDIVANKKHDKAIFEYVEWRKEHDKLDKYEHDEWHGDNR